MQIPYINLVVQWEEERTELLPIIEKVLSSGHYIGGSLIERLEERVASLCGVRYCVALNSGTDALVCGLKALGVGRGDEVITPPNSFVASTAAIVHIGAIPVFVDVLPDQSIDPDLVELAITPKTKAIMPVHLTGRMAQMDRLEEISKKFNIPIIEDAAQAIGSAYQDRPAGSWGKVGCFSTHPLKNLNACGDGGLLTTNDEEITKYVRSIRNHGLVNRNTVERFGYVSRMDTIQAAILEFRISKLTNVIQKRCQNAAFYCENLKHLPIQIPKQQKNEFNTYHTYVIQTNNRNQLQDSLQNEGIETAIHYPIPIHLQPAAKSLGYGPGDFPKTESQSGHILTLPIHQYLKKKDLRIITKSISKCIKENENWDRLR
jgi:dTDP-4-amino-4,6-dideoxygalactose transaminase